MSGRMSRMSVAVLAITAAVAVGVPHDVSAQLRRDGQAVAALGFAFPGEPHDAYGVGAGMSYDRGIWGPDWAQVRVYGGGFFSRTRAESCARSVEPCTVSSNIGVAGAKLRLLAPIPYVAPYFEFGMGTSLGSVTTRVGAYGAYPLLDESHSGVLFHVPLAWGFAFGRNYRHKVSLEYFVHPGRKHVTGVLALGIGL